MKNRPANILVLNKEIIVPPSRGRYLSFPTITGLNNNEYLAAYRSAYILGDDALKEQGEHGINGDIYLINSQNKCRSWDSPCLLYDSRCTGENEQHGILSKDEDGNIFMVSRQFGESFGVFIAEYKKYNGFSERRKIMVKEDFSFWTAYGKITNDLDNGLILPIYGIEKINAGQKCISSAAFLRSCDKGEAWCFGNFIGRPSQDNVSFNETAICKVNAETMMAVMRTDNLDEALYISWSNDNGKSWRKPKDTGIRGDAPEFFNLDCQSILLSYRGINKDQSYGWHMSMTQDEGNSWSKILETGRYTGSRFDGGYGDMTALAENRVYGLYYTCDNHGNTYIEGICFEVRY